MTQRRRGRPTRFKDQIVVFVDADFKARVTKMADAECRMSMSAWARWKLIQAVEAAEAEAVRQAELDKAPY